MRFRLTYEGALKSTQRDPETGQRDPLAPHKHNIRKNFHTQLKELWRTNKFLSECEVDKEWASIMAVPANQVGNTGAYSSLNKLKETRPLAEAVADLYRENKYRFVPLVREDFGLLCSLDILFLRRDYPMSVISRGDLDNRVKTLIDTLAHGLAPRYLATGS